MRSSNAEVWASDNVEGKYRITRESAFIAAKGSKSSGRQPRSSNRGVESMAATQDSGTGRPETCAAARGPVRSLRNVNAALRCAKSPQQRLSTGTARQSLLFRGGGSGTKSAGAGLCTSDSPHAVCKSLKCNPQKTEESPGKRTGFGLTKNIISIIINPVPGFTERFAERDASESGRVIGRSAR